MPKRKLSLKRLASGPEPPAESQAAEAATIGWMLAMLTATVAELGVLAAVLYLRWNPDAKGIAMAGELLLIASAIIGLVILGLTPVVYKIRRLKPPSVVTAFAVAVSLLPWIVIVAQAINHA